MEDAGIAPADESACVFADPGADVGGSVEETKGGGASGKEEEDMLASSSASSSKPSPFARAVRLVRKGMRSRDITLQQRCSEVFQMLGSFDASTSAAVMANALPYDASGEDLEVDAELSFLEDFFSKARAAGAKEVRAASAGCGAVGMHAAIASSRAPR